MQTKHPVEPLDIKIGSTVQCRDGRAGHVAKVVVEPGSKHVTDIVVDRGLLHHDVVVPISLIKSVQGDTIVLDMNVGDLDGLPRFEEVDFAIPDETWSEGRDYPPDAVRVSQSARRCADPSRSILPCASGSWSRPGRG